MDWFLYDNGLRHESFNIFWLSWTYQSNFQIFQSFKLQDIIKF